MSLPAQNYPNTPNTIIYTEIFRLAHQVQTVDRSTDCQNSKSLYTKLKTVQTTVCEYLYQQYKLIVCVGIAATCSKCGRYLYLVKVCEKKLQVYKLREAFKKKSRIRETSNLLTDADSSTNATVGWTKNKQKPKKN